MEAYRAALRNKSDVMVLEPSSDFFKYLKSPGRGEVGARAVTEVLLAAFALMLVIEGILPFVAPRLWRETFRSLIEMSDGQIRFAGLASMAGRRSLMLLAGGLT